MATPFDIEQAELARRRQAAEALAQAQMPGGVQAGRFYVPPSGFDVLGNLATRFLGMRGMKKQGEEEAAFAQRKQEDLQKGVDEFLGAEDRRAAAARALASAHPQLQELAKIELSRQPEKPMEQWDVLSAEDKKALGLPGEDAYQRERRSGQVKKLDNATRVTTEVRLPSPENTYTKKRAEGEADLANTLAEAAQQSQAILRSLDQMEVLNEAGIYSGPTAGIQSFVSGLAATMGLPVDTKKLADSETYAAELYRNVIQTMAQQGGARGFAKEETKMLLDSFPQLTSNPQARAQILAILRNKALQTQEDYNAFRAWEASKFPELPIFDASRQIAPPRPVTPPVQQQAPTGSAIPWDEL